MCCTVSNAQCALHKKLENGEKTDCNDHAETSCRYVYRVGQRDLHDDVARV